MQFTNTEAIPHQWQTQKLQKTKVGLNKRTDLFLVSYADKTFLSWDEKQKLKFFNKLQLVLLEWLLMSGLYGTALQILHGYTSACWLWLL